MPHDDAHRAADGSRRPRGPERLYRDLAFAEAVTWTLLLLGMLLKYVLHVTELGVRLGGGVHGFVFLSYVSVTILVAVDRRWSMRDLLLGLGSSVIPYATIPFERSAARRGLLAQRWRLLEEEPSGPVERVAATALRHPVPALLATLVVLALVFAGLLAAGPPTEWFS
ncbi:DUF3817 domain-containing protein [Mobilicoccus pelagius]|uniref:DUF3817 domain-containing protein n=1 Tax=Mobilicoccus pelagius NBRC 104925 TaxID=1089455 RepID=H5UTM1_9MICO|nr:DUF3817 domain-containing protein [Mobilicoccus pelagius]GAB49079.1 hypothetical protein MOPEL_096_00860 [Mobilicoccus pelagius NBRC 104925]